MEFDTSSDLRAGLKGGEIVEASARRALAPLQKCGSSIASALETEPSPRISPHRSIDPSLGILASRGEVNRSPLDGCSILSTDGLRHRHLHRSGVFS